VADNPGAASAIADSIEALTVILRRDLERVWARVSAQVDQLEQDWPAMGAAARRRRLLELQAHIAALADAADEIAARHVLAGVRDAYLLGAHATALTVGGAMASTGVDLDAITHLATDTHGDLLQATRHMRRTTKDLIRTLARDHVSDRLYTGTPATQAGRDLAKALRSQSVAAIVYKDGSRHGLAEYSSMVVRSKTAEAYQVGGFNQAEGHGVKFMEVMDGPSCGWLFHDDTRQANGLILPIAEARSVPISHPNCVMPGNPLATYGSITEAVRAWYSGPAYRLIAGDYEATVGPNHPVLTRRGWVPAHLLTEGDDLVHDRRLRSDAVALGPGGLHLDEVPAVEDIWVTLGEPSARKLRGDDLHGDAVHCEGEVEVIRPAGVLLLEVEPTDAQESSELMLVGPDDGLVTVPGFGQRDRVLIDSGNTDQGRSAATHPLFDTVGVDGLPSQQIGLAARSHDAAVSSDVQHQSRTTSETRGDGIGAEPFGVELSDLIVAEHRAGLGAAFAGAEPATGEREEVGTAVFAGNRCLGSIGHDVEYIILTTIEVHNHTGWVYDFSTVGGAYSVGGLVVKNCRRVTIPRPDVKSLIGATPKGPQFTAQQLKDAASGSDVGFRKVIDRKGNGILAPAASVARGPAAKRLAALQARRAG
jgi:predicted RNA-binding Zn ribbon-like protein